MVETIAVAMGLGLLAFLATRSYPLRLLGAKLFFDSALALIIAVSREPSSQALGWFVMTIGSIWLFIFMTISTRKLSV